MEVVQRETDEPYGPPPTPIPKTWTGLNQHDFQLWGNTNFPAPDDEDVGYPTESPNLSKWAPFILEELRPQFDKSVLTKAQIQKEYRAMSRRAMTDAQVAWADDEYNGWIVKSERERRTAQADGFEGTKGNLSAAGRREETMRRKDEAKKEEKKHLKRHLKALDKALRKAAKDG